jgi:hypothetical protein
MPELKQGEVRRIYTSETFSGTFYDNGHDLIESEALDDGDHVLVFQLVQIKTVKVTKTLEE